MSKLVHKFVKVDEKAIDGLFFEVYDDGTVLACNLWERGDRVSQQDLADRSAGLAAVLPMPTLEVLRRWEAQGECEEVYV